MGNVKRGFEWQPDYSRLAVKVQGTEVAYFSQNMSYIPLGGSYYVNGTSGSDTNNGLTPTTALYTVTAALAKCTSGNDDYIFVLDGYNSDGGVINVNKDRVHIIGVGNPRNPYPFLVATGTAHVLYVTGDNCEIAYLNLGGAATSYAGICCHGSLGLWVHHCEFGNADVGDTPAYGILCDAGTVNAYMLIENNVFLGSGGTSQGKISAYGIYAAGTNNMRSSIIRNNIFGQIPTTAILLANAYGAFVLDNRIACDADTEAAAISMSGSTGCFIDGNSANYGKTAMAQECYLDSGSANCWGNNYQGNTHALPA